MAKGEVVLNIHFIKNRIIELDLKQYWLAEQIGVDVKTVRRWLQGKVKSVKHENASSLAEVLDCELPDIIMADESDLYATPEDQKKAAELISSSHLIDKLGPIGEWDVVEALLKATIIPNLPSYVLGELYNKLCVASWRQSKIDQSFIYAEKAEQIARKINDKSILVESLLNKANIHSWRGEIQESINKYRECLTLDKFLENRRVGSTFSNLGATLWEIGEIDEGLETQLKALEVFESVGKDMNLSIAHCQLSFIYLEKGELEAAIEEANKSLELAKSAEYRRGEQMGKLVLAEAMARKGEFVLAKQLADEGLEGFFKLDIEEGFNYEFAGKVYKILGHFDEAKNFFKKGISLSEDFPIYLASLYRELALLIIESEGSNAYSIEYLKKSSEIFEQSGAIKRAKQANNILKTGAYQPCR